MRRTAAGRHARPTLNVSSATSRVTSPDMAIIVHHYDAFSSVPDRGNPAGVVLDARGLCEATMQAIATQVGFNQTAFVVASEKASCRLRYFAPGHEMPLCGHATVACIVAMFERGMLPAGSLPQCISIETKAGVLPIAIRADPGSDTVLVEMKQAPAEFVPFAGNLDALSNALGMQVSDVHPDFPIVFGSTGTWTLIVPISTLSAVASMQPLNEAFPDVLAQMPRASVHPFSMETIRGEADLHGRHFSSPFSGIVEDPVTGTASGVMGAYMARYAPRFCAERNYTLQVEQGSELGRDGRVEVEVLNRAEPFEVRIAGNGVFVKDLSVDVHGLD